MIAVREIGGGVNDKFNLVEAEEVCRSFKIMIKLELKRQRIVQQSGLELAGLAKLLRLGEFEIDRHSKCVHVKSILTKPNKIN